jgi:hypothetical protein
VDDVIMFIGINTIDGSGSVIGSAGPCWIDEAPPFTIAGTVVLDFFETVFTEEIRGQDLFSLLWHEIGHAMGIGSYWSILSYLVDEGGPDPRYIGPGGVLEYGNLLGQTVASVEVADQGGFGTRDVHWREAIFGAEIMSPRLDRGVTNPISRMTLGALEDIGWSVDLSNADGYSLSSCQGSCPQAAPPQAAPPAWELPLDVPWGTQARGR